MKKINPQSVLEKGQVLRHEVVSTMLSQYGFEEAKKTGGSHTHFKHEESGITVGLVDGTSNIVYQKEAASKCLEVEAWEATQKAEKQSSLSKGFSLSSQDDGQNAQPVMDAVSDGYDTSDIDGATVIRSAEYPQVGVVSLPMISPSQAQAIETEIDRQSTEYAERLNELKYRYEFDSSTSDDGNVLSLTHKVYGDGFALDIQPYDPSKEDALSRLAEAKSNAEQMDSVVKPWTKEVLMNLDGSEKHPYEKLENGNLKWNIPIKHFVSGEKTEFSLETTQNKRLPINELYAFVQKILEFERGGANDNKRLKNILKESFGIDLVILKTDRSKLAANHAYEPEPLFTLPKVYEQPSITSLHDKIMRTDDEEEHLALLDEVFEITASWDECKKDIVKSLDALIEEQNLDIERYKELMSQDSMLQVSVGKQAPRKGNAGYNIVNHPSFPTPVRINYISRGVVMDTSLGAPTGKGISMTVSPDDLDLLEEMIEEHLKKPPPEMNIFDTLDH